MTFSGTIPDCPLIEISGAPRERGRQYGEQAKQRIQRGVEHYTAQLESAKLGWREIEEIVRAYQPIVEAFEPAYIDEIKGIAEGAGINYTAIFMLNARTEVLKIADRRKNGLPIPIEPDGCTGALVLPKATSAGKLLQVQNWDWKYECAETAVVLKVLREDGPDLITFTEAGGLARSGFNAAGISLTGNYLESDRDYSQVGMPLALMRRKALEQSHLAQTMKIIYTTPKSASNNLIVGHIGGIAIDFECAPNETFQVHPERGLIVHANHWQSPVALGKLKEIGIANTPDSLYRDLRVRELLEPKIGAISKDDLKEAMFDDFQTPWSVCRPPRPSAATNLSATVAMIFMEPESGSLEIAMLPALNRTFIKFKLDMERTAEKQSALAAAIA